ncbi:hypothetical protein N8H74_18305 [Pseudomonas sp. B2M1-30]|uniref:hypothetical protein n=1 Tax=Pseudomonas TaxID=286 RepID=UPI0021C83B1A|nr:MULTISPECIES: hypothetical protein [Pseudomonas]MCU0120218.1 hypothetical protein [Pseudomonas sp. B2M1-30]MCU7260952.1 hypothetical protein [Pseudomonas koreensis]
MSALFKLNKTLPLLTALLITSSPAFAEEATPIGDWWIIYGNGVPNKNIMYVADTTSVVPSNHTKGAKLVAVTLVYEEPGKPMIDVYNMEVQCSTNKVRFLNGQSVERLAYTLRHLKVSEQWQTPRDFWVQRTQAFVCARNAKDMVAMGKMPHLQMIQTVQYMFSRLAPVQQKNQMMDDLDAMLGNKP